MKFLANPLFLGTKGQYERTLGIKGEFTLKAVEIMLHCFSIYLFNKMTKI